MITEDNKKARKSAPFYKCEKCYLICSKKTDYDRHLLTRKHRMITNDNEKARESASFYKCEKCDVICSKQSEYDRHLLTQKHQRIANDNEKMPKNAKANYRVIVEKYINLCQDCVDIRQLVKSQNQRSKLALKYL